MVSVVHTPKNYVEKIYFHVWNQQFYFGEKCFFFFRHLIIFYLLLIFLGFFCPIQFYTWKRILLENVFENLIIFLFLNKISW